MFFYNAYELYYMMNGGYRVHPKRLKNYRVLDKRAKNEINRLFWEDYYYWALSKADEEE